MLPTLPEKKVLDLGYVRLINHMGTDESIAYDAAVSYDKDRETKTDAQVRNLIRFLMRHRHTSPFEQAVIKLEIKCPIFVARQFHRHRTQSINEISARYAQLPSEYHTPDIWRVQDNYNKQGSGDRRYPLVVNASTISDYQELCDASMQFYEEIASDNVAREQARYIVPVSTYTRYVTTLNLHNLLHFLSLRMDKHAQAEARAYAEAIYELVSPLFPHVFEAWNDYVRGAVTFSAQEIGALSLVWDKMRDPELEQALTNAGLSKREIDEFWSKLRD